MWTDHEWDGGWRRWAGCRPQVHWIEGHHLTVFKSPHVEKLAAQLRAALDDHFASASAKTDARDR
jgi:thioesterase domain-containing protein